MPGSAIGQAQSKDNGDQCRDLGEGGNQGLRGRGMRQNLLKQELKQELGGFSDWTEGDVQALPGLGHQFGITFPFNSGCPGPLRSAPPPAMKEGRTSHPKVFQSSMTYRRQRAPVGCSKARSAAASKAPGAYFPSFNSKSTPSILNSCWYCLTMAFLGSVRTRINASLK